MAKPNFQDILLKKGDKIALGVGAALVGSLGLWGVVNFATADSPSSLVKQFDTKASELKRQVAAEGTDAPDLPAWVMKGADKVPIDSTQFALAGPPFEPVFTPSTLRNNPKVLAIDDVQFDYLRIPMRANDIRIGPDGVAEVGVKVNASKGETDPAKLAQNLKGLQGVLGRNGKQPDQFNRRAPAPPAPGARAPGTGGFPGGLPGAGPGGISGSGSGSSGGPPGGIPGGPRGGSSGGPPGGIPRGGSSGGPPGGFGGGSSGGPPGGFGGDAGISSSGGGTADQTVVYVSADEVAKKGLTMAETVYPLRAVVVTATFPIKKQLDEIRQALRAKTNEEAARLAAGPGGTDGPTFAGFEVDRQVLSPGGTWSEWLPFDHKADYQRSIYSRAVDTVPDSGYLAYFVQPGDQEMVYLLPAIADGLGEYKKITLRSVIDQIAKLKALNAVEPTKSDLEKRLSGGAGNNMFAPISGGGAATGTSGGSYPPSMGVPGFGPGSGSSSGAPRPPSPGGSDGSSVPPGGAARLQNQINPGLDIIDHTLLRFIDSDVQPGFSYRYRVKVKMRNPNFGKPTLVSSPDDAKQEVLEGPWQAIPDVFSVPGDNFLYAHDSAEYADSSMKIVESYGKEPAFRKFMEVDEVTAGRKAVVEIQRWMPGVRVGGASSTKVEPVGTWVVAKVPVGPGEFIGKRQFLELPLWSGGLGNYVLRELAGGLKIAGVKDPKHQPRGWPLNFGTASVLIDFEGGKTTKVRVNDRDVADDSDSELLIVQPDGKLVVLNSGTDGANKDRKERDAVWTDWVSRVKDRRDVSVPGTGMPAPPGVGGGFGKPGGI